MRKSLAFLLTSFFTVGMASCGEDLSTNVVNTEENPSLYQPMPSYPNADGILGTVQFLYAPTAFPTDNPIVMKAGFAKFGGIDLPNIPGIDSLSDAGSVSVNDYGLRKFRYDSSLVYSSFSHRHPAVLTSVNFDSTAHIFSVTGSTFIPAFTLPVISPHDFAVGKPVKNTPVSVASQGLTLEWGGGSDTSRNQILIRLTSSDTSYTRQGIADRGFYNISPSVLAPFTGEVTLDIVKYRDTTITLGGRTYTAFSQIVKTIPIRIL